MQNFKLGRESLWDTKPRVDFSKEIGDGTFESTCDKLLRDLKPENHIGKQQDILFDRLFKEMKVENYRKQLNEDGEYSLADNRRFNYSNITAYGSSIVGLLKDPSKCRRIVPIPNSIFNYAGIIIGPGGFN